MGRMVFCDFDGTITAVETFVAIGSRRKTGLIFRL